MMVCVNQERSCILYLYICQGSSYGNLVAAPTAKFQFTRQQSIQLNRRNYVATPASLVEAVRTTLSSVTNEAAAQVLNTEFKWLLRVWYQYLDHNWDFYHLLVSKPRRSLIWTSYYKSCVSINLSLIWQHDINF